jgi:ribonuclease P protein component
VIALIYPNIWYQEHIFMSSFSFLKTERLLSPRDYVKLNRVGRREQTAHFKIIFAENGLGIRRLGITVGRKAGNSVVRNRVKRLVREFFRLHKADFPQGCDILIAAKQGAHHLDYWKVKEELGAFILDKELRLSP